MYKLNFMFLIFAVSANVSAQIDAQINKAELVLEDEILGVEVKLDSQGTLLSAVSSYSQTVDIPDRRGINKAYLIAEEKAKAQLVRFISQDITTSRTVEQIEKSIENAGRNSGNKEENWSKMNSRELKEIVTEVSTSAARGTLRGVKIISKSYDEKKEEVTVTVGINQKNLSSSKALTETNKADRENQNSTKYFPVQPSENKKAKDFDEYR